LEVRPEQKPYRVLHLLEDLVGHLLHLLEVAKELVELLLDLLLVAEDVEDVVLLL